MKKQPQDILIFKKICVLGSLDVDQNSLVENCLDLKSSFSESYSSLIGLQILRKNIVIKSNKGTQQIYLIIWNIPSSPKFSAVFPRYLKGAKGAIILGDLSYHSSLEYIEWYLETFSTINPQAQVIIILNKSNLVTSEKLNNLIKRYSFENHPRVKATYIIASKTHNDIEQIFVQLAKDIC